MDENDIRWEQRFQNYEQALSALQQITENVYTIDKEIVIDATIQRFEIVFDLAWKTLQDYLYYLGYTDYKGPKRVIAKAFQDNIIANGENWARLHEDRNILSHNYDYDKSRLIYERITKEYYQLFVELYTKLSNERKK